MRPRIFAVVPAAGKGARMGAALPKQYLSVEGRTIAEHTLSRLLAFAPFLRIVVAVACDDVYFDGLSLATDPRLLRCPGGAERCDSVANALAALADEARDEDFVLVHDIARPCVRLSDLARLIDAVGDDEVGGLLAHRATDTVKQAGAQGGRVAATIDRGGIWLAATPQLLRHGLLRDALMQAHREGVRPTDEAQAVERLGHSPLLVECARDNLKVTRPEDLALAAFWLRQQQEEAGA